MEQIAGCGLSHVSCRTSSGAWPSAWGRPGWDEAIIRRYIYLLLDLDSTFDTNDLYQIGAFQVDIDRARLGAYSKQRHLIIPNSASMPLQ